MVYKKVKKFKKKSHKNTIADFNQSIQNHCTLIRDAPFPAF